MLVPLEFTTTYDRTTLDAGARKMFNHFWSPLFPHFAIALLIAGVIGSVISYFVSSSSETTKIFVFFTLAAAASWIGLFLRFRSLLRKKIGMRGTFAIDRNSLSADFGDRSARYPWTDFLSIETDVTNVFLFFRGGGAIVIPKKDIPVEGLQLIEAMRATTWRSE